VMATPWRCITTRSSRLRKAWSTMEPSGRRRSVADRLVLRRRVSLNRRSIRSRGAIHLAIWSS
jgi:hypothetical protein